MTVTLPPRVDGEGKSRPVGPSEIDLLVRDPELRSGLSGEGTFGPGRVGGNRRVDVLVEVKANHDLAGALPSLRASGPGPSCDLRASTNSVSSRIWRAISSRWSK